MVAFRLEFAHAWYCRSVNGAFLFRWSVSLCTFARYGFPPPTVCKLSNRNFEYTVLCQGICTKDTECQEDLKCFTLSSATQAVPGCSNFSSDTIPPGNGYCYMPSNVPSNVPSETNQTKSTVVIVIILCIIALIGVLIVACARSKHVLCFKEKTDTVAYLIM